MIHVGKALARFFGVLFILGAAIGAGTIGVAVLSSAAATVITVNDATDPVSQVPSSNCNPNSEGDCTLRAALAEATFLNEAVTINLPNPQGVPNNPELYYSVNSNVGELNVADTGGTVTIAGAGESVVDIRAGCVSGCTNNTRVLEIGSGVLGGISANISGVTISNGNAPVGQGSDCGGICVSSSGSQLTLTNSVVSGNTAITFGGGIGLYRGGSATLTNDTVTGNSISGAGGGGGGIYVVSNDTTSVSNLTIRNTTISGNQVDAGNGGGIDVFNTSGSGVDGNVTIDIDRSTISGNEITGSGAGSGIAASDGIWTVTNSTVGGNNNAGTPVDGGGAFIANAASGTALNSTWNFDTIAGNSAGTTGQGGNLYVQSGSALDLGESIVAGGVAGSGPSDCSGSLDSLGYNLIDDTTCGTPGTGDIVGQSPQLGTLANNGGPTRTQLPASASPAVGAVPASVTSGTGVSVDQRGDARGQGQNGTSTIGSVEVAQATPPPPTTTTTTHDNNTTTPNNNDHDHHHDQAPQHHHDADHAHDLGDDLASDAHAGLLAGRLRRRDLQFRVCAVLRLDWWSHPATPDRRHQPDGQQGRLLARRLRRRDLRLRKCRLPRIGPWHRPGARGVGPPEQSQRPDRRHGAVLTRRRLLHGGLRRRRLCVR